MLSIHIVKNIYLIFQRTNVKNVRNNLKESHLLFDTGKKTHRQNELLKLRLKNDHLKLKMDLYIDQIKFLQQLIQFYNLQRITAIRSSGMNQHNLTATNEQ